MRIASMERVARLRAVMAEKNLSALLVTNGDNRRYISGFTGSAGHALVTGDRTVLLTDFRYTEQAAEQASGFEIRLLRSLLRELADLKKEYALGVLGVESTAWNYKAYSELAEAAGEAGITLAPVLDIVEPLRVVKDPEEIATIERAVALADRAVTEVSNRLRPGMTELEVAWAIERHMREAGAEGMAFEVIVGSGPRGAMPHARPSGRAIATGEPIVLDLGCIVDGYRSDLTRTVCIGDPDPKYLQVYDIVLRAQQAAIEQIHLGMKAGDADAIARDLIREAGYGDRFGHSLGHGIGLETHEAPFVRENGEELLAEGSVFSVEPGIYLPGEFGVRIEDLVVLEARGTRVLSRAPKTPVLGR